MWQHAMPVMVKVSDPSRTSFTLQQTEHDDAPEAHPQETDVRELMTAMTDQSDVEFSSPPELRTVIRKTSREITQTTGVARMMTSSILRTTAMRVVIPMALANLLLQVALRAGRPQAQSLQRTTAVELRRRRFYSMLQ